MLTNTKEQLLEGVLRHGPSILNKCIANPVEISQYIDRLLEEHLSYPIPPSSITPSNWHIPVEYKEMDIEGFLVNQCPKQHYDRLISELDLFHKHNMMPVLRTMKYVVDTLRANNIVWGVGRGSSVASYVLYLIGVHKVDSIKYNLPIEEFFKEI